ncbi:MAG: VOC family protein [Vicinamibacterales bacterium]
MANPAGSFIWYELMTGDPDAAKTFYDAVVGWSIAPAPAPNAGGMDYRMIGRSDGRSAGGVLRISDDMRADGARPMWAPYLFAPDTDAAVAAIAAEGGKVLMPATTVDGAGRLAMVADPQGVLIYVMTPAPPPGQSDATSDVFSPAAEQRVGWNELASPDLAGSKAFYAKHFGFEFNESMNMGPMGDYCFIDHHGQRLGAIMQRQSEQQPAAWLLYFRVPALAAAKAAIVAGGGTVLVGPMQVPNGEWILLAMDPEGAGFGLLSARAE